MLHIRLTNRLLAALALACLSVGCSGPDGSTDNNANDNRRETGVTHTLPGFEVFPVEEVMEADPRGLIVDLEPYAEGDREDLYAPTLGDGRGVVVTESNWRVLFDLPLDRATAGRHVVQGEGLLAIATELWATEVDSSGFASLRLSISQYDSLDVIVDPPWLNGEPVEIRRFPELDRLDPEQRDEVAIYCTRPRPAPEHFDGAFEAKCDLTVGDIMWISVLEVGFSETVALSAESTLHHWIRDVTRSFQ